MADKETTFRLKFEDEDMEKVFDSFIGRVEESNNGLRELEKTQKEVFNSMAKDVKKSNEQLNQQTSRLDLNKVAFTDLKNKAQDSLESITQKSSSATSTITRLGRAGGLVGTVLAGVGAAIVGAFLDVEKNAKAAKRELEGIKAVGNELKTRTFAGLRGVVQAAIGNLGEAGKEFRTAVSNITEDLIKAQQEGREFFDLREQIAQSNRELIKTEAQRTVQLQKIQALSNDETKTTAERIDLIKSAAAIENEINSLRISELTNELELRRSENKLYGDQEGSLEAIAAIEAELIELRGASQVINIQTQQEINGLLQEEAELRAKIIGQIKDANALITNQQAERSLEKQIESFKELRASISASGLSDEYATELAELDRVIDGLSNRLADGLAKPLEELPGKISDTLQIGSLTAESLGDELERGAQEAIEQLQNAFTVKSESFFEQFSDEQKKFLEDSFKDVLGSISDIVIQGTVTQINQQEAVIDAREGNISDLERQLAEQERLEGQGLANQSSRLKQSLQEERAILKREQDRRLELEKRAARQRLIANSVQQGSEITLAASKLLNQGASGFIPGLIAAAGGIALLFRIIAQAKANSAAFSAPPQFREGTNYLVGPSHEGGGITIEAEGGERIFSKSLNEALGGSKYTNEEIHNFALMGMNSEQAIAPMAAAIASGAASQKKVAELERSEVADSIRQMGDKMIAEMEDIMKTIKERPTYYPTDQTGRREYYKGGTKVIEKILPKD